MIDFVSTREETDGETRACARLVTAIIVQAVRDAAAPLAKAEKEAQRNLDDNARHALRFLFEPKSALAQYATAIGSSAHAIRSALMSPADAVTARSSFNDIDRRTLQLRARMQGFARDAEAAQ